MLKIYIIGLQVLIFSSGKPQVLVSNFHTAYNQSFWVENRDILLMFAGVFIGLIISFLIKLIINSITNFKKKKFYKPFEGTYISRDKMNRKTIYHIAKLTYYKRKFTVYGIPMNPNTDFTGEFKMDDIITIRGEGIYQHFKDQNGYIGSGNWTIVINIFEKDKVLVNNEYIHKNGLITTSQIWEKVHGDDLNLTLDKLKEKYYKPPVRW